MKYAVILILALALQGCSTLDILLWSETQGAVDSAFSAMSRKKPLSESEVDAEVERVRREVAKSNCKFQYPDDKKAQKACRKSIK